MFKGGVLTFKLYAESLGLPREALFVIVDGKVESTIGSGSDMANGRWVVETGEIVRRISQGCERWGEERWTYTTS